MHKLLVTGANGYVGSALCRALCDHQISFVGSVREKTAQSQIKIGNLTGATKWSDALSGCDVIIHLAARVHVMKDKVSDPIAAYRETNVAATMNLARQAVELGVKRFVFVSSVKVNGEVTKDQSFTPHDIPMPIDPYGQSKLEAELALKELSHKTGLELVIIRPPLVYGPNVRANFLRLMRLVKSGMPLPFGAVHNRRSMVALDNLTDLLIVCSRHPEAAGQTFMVSDDNDVSVSELIRMIASAMGKRSLLIPLPSSILTGAASILGKSEVANRLIGSLQVDISHTKATLGWKPIISMPDALHKTVEHFTSHL
jgi:UDP-glucose 4-epimerase